MDSRSPFYLESSWTSCTGIDPASLPKKERSRQEAIWELIATESQYLKTLRLLIDLFYGGLASPKNGDRYKNIDLLRLFGNVHEVYQANLKLWESNIVPLLNKCRQRRLPLNIYETLAEAFMDVENLFSPYIQFCIQQEVCISYAKKLTETHEHFSNFLNWAESRKECQRQKLVDLIIVPMQRLTKYTLIFNSILKATNDKKEIELLNLMIVKVDAFVSKVNKAVRNRSESLKLLAIHCRIEGCDYLETHNEECSRILESFGCFDLINAPCSTPDGKRSVLYEGAIRLREGQSKIEAYLILITDILLITKTTKLLEQDHELTYTDDGIASTNNGLRLIKPPIRLDKLDLRELRDGQSALLVVFTDFQPTVATSFIISCDNLATWIAKIRLAQSAHLRSIKLKMRQRKFSREMVERRHALSVLGKSVISAPSSPIKQQNGRGNRLLNINRIVPSDLQNLRRHSESDLQLNHDNTADSSKSSETSPPDTSNSACPIGTDNEKKKLTLTLSIASNSIDESANACANQPQAEENSLRRSHTTLPQIQILSDTPTSTPRKEFKHFDYKPSTSSDEKSTESEGWSTTLSKKRKRLFTRGISESGNSPNSCWRRGSWSGNKRNDTIQCLISLVHSHSFYRLSDDAIDKTSESKTQKSKDEKSHLLLGIK